MYSSYKDALLLGKAVEQPKKTVQKSQYKTFYTSEIKKMCIWGKLDELKQVNPTYFTKDNINELNKIMKEKIDEIECWKYEDQNNFSNVLEEFDERIKNIKTCMEWITNFDNSDQEQK